MINIDYIEVVKAKDISTPGFLFSGVNNLGNCITGTIKDESEFPAAVHLSGSLQDKRYTFSALRPIREDKVVSFVRSKLVFEVDGSSVRSVEHRGVSCDDAGSLIKNSCGIFIVSFRGHNVYLLKIQGNSFPSLNEEVFVFDKWRLLIGDESQEVFKK